MKRCVILNPKAGSVKDLDAVIKQLGRLEASSFHLTKNEGAAKAFAREAVRDHCDEIIAAGGDGTLNEVINGIAKRVGDVRIGLIPLGTGNDFARCLNLRATLEENIDIVLSGETTAIDVVRTKSDRIRYFRQRLRRWFQRPGQRKINARAETNMGSSRLPAQRCGGITPIALVSHRCQVRYERNVLGRSSQRRHRKRPLRRRRSADRAQCGPE
jgi:Diacylglycerol kinase catalytic domain